MTILTFTTFVIFSIMLLLTILFIYISRLIFSNKYTQKYEAELEIQKQAIANALNKRLEEEGKENG